MSHHKTWTQAGKLGGAGFFGAVFGSLAAGEGRRGAGAAVGAAAGIASVPLLGSKKGKKSAGQALSHGAGAGFLASFLTRAV